MREKDPARNHHAHVTEKSSLLAARDQPHRGLAQPHHLLSYLHSFEAQYGSDDGQDRLEEEKIESSDEGSKQRCGL